VKFSIAQETPQIELEDVRKGYLAALAGELEEGEWSADTIHNAIYELAKSRELKPKMAFQTLYQAILDQNYGPRLGYFLSTLDKDWVVGRIREVAQ
jgi:lysyl-tRNA synthetase class 1